MGSTPARRGRGLTIILRLQLLSAIQSFNLTAAASMMLDPILFRALPGPLAGEAEKTKSRQDKQKACHPEPVEGRQVCHSE